APGREKPTIRQRILPPAFAAWDLLFGQETRQRCPWDPEHERISFDRGGAGNLPPLRGPRPATTYIVPGGALLEAGIRPGRFPRRPAAFAPARPAPVTLRSHPVLRAPLLLLHLQPRDRAGPAAQGRRPERGVPDGPGTGDGPVRRTGRAGRGPPA